VAKWLTLRSAKPSDGGTVTKQSYRIERVRFSTRTNSRRKSSPTAIEVQQNFAVMPLLRPGGLNLSLADFTGAIGLC